MENRMKCNFCESNNPARSIFCGRCGKILMRAYGRTDSNCPCCSAQFARRPIAKTKCKNCQRYIFVRTRPTDSERVLLTEEDAEQVAMQWATIRGGLDYYLEEKAKKGQIEQELRLTLRREPKKYEIQTEYLKRENPIRREQTKQT